MPPAAEWSGRGGPCPWARPRSEAFPRRARRRCVAPSSAPAPRVAQSARGSGPRAAPPARAGSLRRARSPGLGSCPGSGLGSCRRRRAVRSASAPWSPCTVDETATRSTPARRNLPAGSPIDTLRPIYGTENTLQKTMARNNRGGMVKKIALEEHFLCPGFEGYWQPTVGDVDPAIYNQVVARLSDFGELRLAAMDRAGIARSVLSLAGPGVQAERDSKTACRNARAANDVLAREIAKRPDRYSGFAHLPMQDAAAAADELERCLEELKFSGAMINGHTNGQYLDDPALHPFWERAQALDAAIYLHPTDPVVTSRALDGHTGLRRATWEWGFETGSHALRLVFGGHFDRFPRAKLILGHLGETLPYLLWRFDSRAQLYGVKLAKPPSHYIKENIVVTTSGMSSAEPLTCAISALGHERVMFAADYPFESPQEAAHFIDGTALADAVRNDICSNNAERFLKLAS